MTSDLDHRSWRSRGSRKLFQWCRGDSRRHAEPYISLYLSISACLTIITDLTQILALLTMERPKSFSADDLCAEKVLTNMLWRCAIIFAYLYDRLGSWTGCYPSSTTIPSLANTANLQMARSQLSKTRKTCRMIPDASPFVQQ